MTIKSYHQLRDEVLKILNETYAPDFADKDWYWCKYSKKAHSAVSMNMDLVVLIFAAIAFAHLEHPSAEMGDYYRRTLHNEIMQIIWITWPGGTTAKAVADDICEILNIEKEDE